MSAAASGLLACANSIAPEARDRELAAGAAASESPAQRRELANTGSEPAADDEFTDAAPQPATQGQVTAEEGCFTLRAGSLDGFAIHPVAELVNDPRAGTPSYAYLERNQQAIQIEAPALGAADGVALDALDFAGSTLHVSEAPHSDAPFEVLVPGDSGALRYLVTGDDFEQEVELRRVVLCLAEDRLEASFVFAGTGLGGVAHAMSIHVEHADTRIGSSAPIAIEVR